MDEGYITNITIITLLLFTVIEYSIEMKRIYPVWMMSFISEPYVRFILYVIVYVLACYNVPIAVLFSIVVVLLHLDYINLVKKTKLK